MAKAVAVLVLCFMQILVIHTKEVRIIDGQISKSGEFPFAVAYYFDRPEGRHFCGGSLISNHWVLTAAHCLENSSNFAIYVGIDTLEEASSTGLPRGSSRYVMHPEYKSEFLHNDIGLILLESSVTFSDKIQPVELPTEILSPNIQTIALGWGSVNDAQSVPSNTLNYVQLTTIANAVCRRIYGELIHEHMVCVTGTENQGICGGDSGGALIATNAEGKVVQVGVASFYSAVGCETDHPSGFTRTFEYVEWIRNVTDSRSNEMAKSLSSVLIFLSALTILLN